MSGDEFDPEENDDLILEITDAAPAVARAVLELREDNDRLRARVEELEDWQRRAKDELKEWQQLCSVSHAPGNEERDRYYRIHAAVSAGLITEAESGHEG